LASAVYGTVVGTRFGTVGWSINWDCLHEEEGGGTVYSVDYSLANEDNTDDYGNLFMLIRKANEYFLYGIYIFKF
jgi:hypothetical protein